MFSKLRRQLTRGRKTVAVGFSLAGLIVFASTYGWFEALELSVLDQFFKWRALSDSTIDRRILVVTIDESDLGRAEQWPISDEMLAQLVDEIAKHEPAGIGIDLYRNFPVAPGSERLTEVFKSIPTVIGAERVVGEPVAPHATLAELGQSAAIDLVVDDDGRVRRGLLSVISPSSEVKQGLAAALVLNYLAKQDIYPEIIEDRTSRLSLQLGKSVIFRFEKNDGGYVNADTGGYQVLMNYSGDYRQFKSIALSDVLDGKLTDEMVRDRIVLIGSVAVSLPDLFYTPLHREQQTSGVYIHAHLVSQLLKAALDGRPFLRTASTSAEWLWACVWLAVSVLASRSFLFNSRSLDTKLPIWQVLARFIGLSGGLGATGYALFVAGWWLPMVLPFSMMIAAVSTGVVYRNQQLQLLAAYDDLTQVANRRYFDQYLAQSLKSQKKLSLILCDVDYFKLFNDLYGHPAGDRCLYQVAQALEAAVRDADLVARYGGEEFVIVLPDTEEEGASWVAQRIQDQIGQLKIVHEGSAVNQWVTLSCGSASVPQGVVMTPHLLVEYADKALYEAKRAGRNRVIASRWAEINKIDPNLKEVA
ncbi:MAG: CHASE2 domain-containing protein [Phormidesmis sp.]